MVSASPILAPNHQYSKRDLRAWATHFPKAARRADERTGGEAAAEAGCSATQTGSPPRQKKQLEGVRRQTRTLVGAPLEAALLVEAPLKLEGTQKTKRH